MYVSLFKTHDSLYYIIIFSLYYLYHDKFYTPIGLSTLYGLMECIINELNKPRQEDITTTDSKKRQGVKCRLH
jgi:hypothetical protein